LPEDVCKLFQRSSRIFTILARILRLYKDFSRKSPEISAKNYIRSKGYSPWNEVAIILLVIVT